MTGSNWFFLTAWGNDSRIFFHRQYGWASLHWIIAGDLSHSDQGQGKNHLGKINCNLKLNRLVMERYRIGVTFPFPRHYLQRQEGTFPFNIIDKRSYIAGHTLAVAIPAFINALGFIFFNTPAVINLHEERSNVVTNRSKNIIGAVTIRGESIRYKERGGALQEYLERIYSHTGELICNG